ncbi:MAG: TonB-dependent siderophore receptor [Deltaproteobacteria bacterium]|nr:TonB-dependent siderophore receptor [Deltaproteobacteria bacterium]
MGWYKRTQIATAAVVILTMLLPAAVVADDDEPDSGEATKKERREQASKDKPALLLEPIVVVGKRDNSYLFSAPTSASRIPLDVMDTPRSVQVVPRAVIDDQQAITPNEITRSVSSVRPSGAWYGNDEAFITRGFLQQNVYKDGLRGAAIVGFIDQPAAGDVAELDRVEVIKGPASFLFGRVEPGGIVNYITKQPSFSPAYSLMQRFGSYDLYRTEADLTGPVTDNLAYRLIGSYQRGGLFERFTEEERGFGSASALWRPNDSTQVRLRTSFAYDDSVFAAGLPIVDGRLLDGVAYNQFLGEPSVNKRISRALETYVEAVHRVNESLQLTLLGGYQPAWLINRDLELGEFLVPDQIPYYDPDSRTLARTLYDSNFKTQDAQLELGANLSYAPADLGLGWLRDVRGNLVATAGWERNEAHGPLTFGTSSRVNPFTPVYQGYFLSEDIHVHQDLHGAANEVSGGIENSLRWRDRVELLAGVRVSYVDSHAAFDLVPAEFSEHGGFHETRPVPFVGALVRPLRPLSLYTSYSESYLPYRFPRLTAHGGPLQPETGSQIEGGVRWESFDSRLLATAAIYQIDKDHLIAPDPQDPIHLANIGSARSRGFELDVAGSPLPGWDLIGSYAYTDARITDSPDGTQGNRLFAVPYNSGSLWTTYELQTEPLRGLGAGIGVFFSDSVENDTLNSAKLPSWVQADAALFYAHEKFEARLNLKNFTDEKVFLSQNDSFRAIPAPPLTVLGSISVHF